MPEERQIGRAGSIELLSRRLDAANHQWLIGPRRIGKTSVAKAALARLRADGVVALDVDMSKLAITTERELAGEIARQAQAAHAGVVSTRSSFGRFARRHAGDARRLGKVATDFGYSDEGDALAAVAYLLAGADDGSPGLASVLEALAIRTYASERRSVVLLDEVHLLADIDGCERDFARWARDVDSPIVLVLAGSEESAVRALREPGRPLASIGEELPLPEISTEDWLHGLRHRFREAGVKIDDAQLLCILEASEGHPRRTMLICAGVYGAATANPEREAPSVLVQLAIREARGDRSWT